MEVSSLGEKGEESTEGLIPLAFLAEEDEREDEREVYSLAVVVAKCFPDTNWILRTNEIIHIETDF